MSETILATVFLVVLFTVVILLRVWSIRTAANSPKQIAENIFSKTKADQSIIASFICFHSSKGCAGLYIAKDRIWCENNTEVLFDIYLENLQRVEYSNRNFFRFVTSSEIHKIAYLHSPDEGQKTTTLLVQNMAYTDPAATSKLVSCLSSLKVHVEIKPHRKVLFYVSQIFAYPGGKLSLIIIIVVIVVIVLSRYLSY